MLLAPAIERGWVLFAPLFAPLAPLVSAVLRGHMMQAFVPAYSDYNLAEARRPAGHAAAQNGHAPHDAVPTTAAPPALAPAPVPVPVLVPMLSAEL